MSELDNWLSNENYLNNIDDFIDWCDEVYDTFSDRFIYDPDNDPFFNSPLEKKWLNKLYDKDYDAEDSAKIIERTFYLYKIDEDMLNILNG